MRVPSRLPQDAGIRPGNRQKPVQPVCIPGKPANGL